MSIRIAGPNPGWCASCFNQQPEMRHIDFDSGIDRGTLTYGDGQQIAMDDLMICETCVKAGAAALGMVDGDEESSLVSLRRELQQTRRERDAALAYADGVEEAISHRPVPLKTPRRKAA